MTTRTASSAGHLCSTCAETVSGWGGKEGREGGRGGREGGREGAREGGRKGGRKEGRKRRKEKGRRKESGLSSFSLPCSSARWGRCQEGYGEDPFLQAEIGTQYVKGLQYGPDPKHIEAIVS